MDFLSWEEAKKKDEYYYSGNERTPNEIADIFQRLANLNKDEYREVVYLEYNDYRCDIDIFWQDTYVNKTESLSIEMFVTYKYDTINNSEELKISDIYKKDYLEREMYNFILESAQNN